MEGAKKICKQAGIPLAGGHSIDAPEPFFGLSVNGLSKKTSIKRNNTLQTGDLIFLTKPIGSGILSTALKRKQLNEEDYAEFIGWITKLNCIGETLGEKEYVHALTDVTGFGLLGHLLEMIGDHPFTIELFYNKIPVIESSRKYLSKQIVSDATYRNWNHYHTQVEFGANINVMEAFNLLPDPQTNGGLLIAVPETAVKNLKEVFEKYQLADFCQPIAQVVNAKSKKVSVEFK
jgi:selenide,water dikinase